MRSEDNSGGCVEKVGGPLVPSRLSFDSLALILWAGPGYGCTP